MTKHSKSLLLSILIHSMLLGGIFYAYNEVSSFIGDKKEKRVCIKLGSIQSIATQTQESKKEEKKVEKVKKTVKKTPQKKPPKQKVKKKPLPKKVIPLQKKKEVIKPPQEIEKVEEEQLVKEDVIIEQDECPAQQQKSQSKNKIIEAQQQNRQIESSKDRYMNRHLAEIAQLLQENLYYPRRARKRGIEGKVVVKFTLTQDAEVINSKILSSSDEILSRGALRTLENLSGEFPKPDEELTLTVPISYSLH
ncbi:MULTISPECIES: energy transducer TonB [Sulfurimonas]|uniref:TonB family protein n=1 Tax=Sulfurimonas TaxID=202746 RepID=UPI00165FD154|nr:energy transducer TonB [Sulfurimonas indica]